MSKVELFEDIRRARRDEGISIRDASKRFRVHRRDVRRAVNGQEPVPRAVASSRPAPVSGPWREWMRQVCGSINFRWQEGTTELPPYCLGHIGYEVFPWKRNKGYASEALKQILPEAVKSGMPFSDISLRAALF